MSTSQGAGGDTSQGTNGEESSGGITGDAAVTAFWYARGHSASVPDATRVSKNADMVVKEFYKKRDAGEPITNAMAGAWNKAKTAEVMVAAMEGVKFISGNYITKLRMDLEDLDTSERELNELFQRLPKSDQELLDYFKTVKTKTVNKTKDCKNALRMEMENVAAAEAKIKEMTKTANAIWAAIAAENFCTSLRF